MSDPPRIEPNAEARAACTLYRIQGKAPTLGDLEVGYTLRGRDLLACDLKRALAVAGHDREHAAEDEWRDQREDRRAPWWQVWR